MDKEVKEKMIVPIAILIVSIISFLIVLVRFLR